MTKKIEELEAKVKSLMDEIEDIKKKNCKTALLSLKPGDEFQLAGHTFIVLDHAGGETAVISKDFWGGSIEFGNDRNYKESPIRKFLEEKVLPELEADIGSENILEHTRSLRSVDGKNEFGEITCKIRLATFDEVRKYTNYTENKELDDWWWTCTPWSTEERGWKHSVAVVSPSGYFLSRIYSGSCGVRPFCILKSDIFVSI